MRRQSHRWLWGIGVAIAIAASYHLAGRTVDFQVYYVGAGDFFRGLRPIYGALSGIGWPMHYRYPPLFIFIFAPLTLLPMAPAAGIWVGAKFLVLVRLARAMILRLDFEGRYAWVPVLIAGPFVVQEFQYGNAQFFIFALVAAALLWSRSRPVPAAGALALATSIKVWPLFFFPYLILRRDWKTVRWAAALTLVLTLLPAFYFGIDGMAGLLGQWARQEFSTQAGATEVWYPSQSLRGVLMRYLTVIDYTAVPDSEYSRGLESLGYTYVPDANYTRIEVANLDPDLVRRLWLVVAAAAYAGLLALAHFRRRSEGWAEHGAAWCALVLLQPFTQKYALAVLLWPALVAGVLLSGRVATTARIRMAVYASVTLIAIQPFFSGLPLQRDLQVVGLDFVATSLLAFVMVWASVRNVDLGPPRRTSRPELGDTDTPEMRPVGLSSAGVR